MSRGGDYRSDHLGRRRSLAVPGALIERASELAEGVTITEERTHRGQLVSVERAARRADVVNAALALGLERIAAEGLQVGLEAVERWGRDDP